MRTRLYGFHGSAADPRVNGQVLVVDWNPDGVDYGQGTLPGPSNQTIRYFDTMDAAEEFVRNDGSAQVGGVQGVPTEPVPALEHYRLVHASEETNRQVGPWVKTFERVNGATVEGTGPANATVTASVELRIPTQNGTRYETFTYSQHAETDDQGRFTMTLPYSSTGYDEFGPDNGHTNVSVRATGPYEFRNVQSAGNGTQVVTNTTADVTEAQVLGEDDSVVEVSLDQTTTVEGNASANGTDESAAPNGSSGANDTDTANDTNDTATNGPTGTNDTDGANATNDSGSNDTGGTETDATNASALAAAPVGASAVVTPVLARVA
jgi:dolichyl-diphosphooligosaccharide--protein glycosyltransferase